MPPGIAARFFMAVYTRFGPGGLLALPFFTMTCEKVCYDTFQAFRGHDIYTNGMHEGARGGFPSGGNTLPSFSLLPVQKWDKPKDNEKVPEMTGQTGAQRPKS